jgi:cytochrome b561
MAQAGWFNSEAGYGRLTKICHWLIMLLFALQYGGGLIMQQLPPKAAILGLDGNELYNWHKSLGLVALLIALIRIWNRRRGSLPPWAGTLSAGERRFIHRAEQALYAAMFVMPVSGFFFVMAGGYGVLLFGTWPLPNPVGKIGWLATLAQWIHFISAWALLATIAAHIALVLRHALFVRDGLLKRML